jgi:UDP-N-acetylmuramoylalanine--D-glutamate ligase
MKVAILGYALEGQQSASYWHKLDNEVTICDQNPSLEVEKKYQTNLGKDYLKNLDQYDIIVRTAGLNPQKILDANPESPELASKITTSLNEFLDKCPSPNTIGVTGTKGKGTTSSLIAKILKAAGKKVHLGGNIGVAPLELLPKVKADDWVVLELSSFQLSDVKYAPHIAVCLMVVSEHLDWHADFQDYTSAKANLFIRQSENDTAIYFAGNESSKTIASNSPGRIIPYFSPPGAYVRDDGMIVVGYNQTEILPIKKLKLLGRHNQQNVCAAVTTVWQVAQDVDSIAKVLKSFKGLEHRLELVKEVGGVKYYDDSFGTTPETAIVAMQAIEGPKVLILGGSDKGALFEELTGEVIKQNVRHVVAIGKTGPAIVALLRQKGYDKITEDLDAMPAIVKEAKRYAKKGDVVLLSTGCASFGLFKDYKDRGNQFKQAVHSLK